MEASGKEDASGSELFSALRLPPCECLPATGLLAAKRPPSSSLRSHGQASLLNSSLIRTHEFACERLALFGPLTAAALFCRFPISLDGGSTDSREFSGVRVVARAIADPVVFLEGWSAAGQFEALNQLLLHLLEGELVHHQRFLKWTDHRLSPSLLSSGLPAYDLYITTVQGIIDDSRGLHWQRRLHHRSDRRACCRPNGEHRASLCSSRVARGKTRGSARSNDVLNERTCELTFWASGARCLRHRWRRTTNRLVLVRASARAPSANL
jgi:hypothetical protein